jgi:hypothetical protein
MHAVERPWTVALLAVTAGFCLALALVGAADGLPYLVPALLLTAPLAWGVYVGEERLLSLGGADRRRPRRAPASTVPARSAEQRLPRGSRLIATSLAKRPPPLLTVDR